MFSDLGAMNRPVLLLSVALCFLVLGISLRFARPAGAAAPRLALLGFTNSLDGSATLAVLCLSNSTRHRILLEDSATGPATFFIREAKTSAGWQAIDVPALQMADRARDVYPKQSYVFEVPVITNHQEGWRVTVQFVDGDTCVQLPLLGWTDLPWIGSGHYHDRLVSSGTLMRQR